MSDEVKTSIGPSGWSEQERARYFDIQNQALPGNPIAKGHNGAVTTALNGLAARVGLEALNQGGSATDAAIATAFTQIVLGGGAVISFFGIGAMMHYDAETDTYSSINAGWNTCLHEDDPLSIPGAASTGEKSIDDMLGTEPSGRTAMVGGFLRGVEKLHRLYGNCHLQDCSRRQLNLRKRGFRWGPD
ncbi:MAG: hypothetical protein AAGC95_07425 [Pseudomonadota bacterium]